MLAPLHMSRFLLQVCAEASFRRFVLNVIRLSKCLLVCNLTVAVLDPADLCSITFMASVCIQLLMLKIIKMSWEKKGKMTSQLFKFRCFVWCRHQYDCKWWNEKPRLTLTPV